MKQTLKSWGQEQAEPEDEPIGNNGRSKEGSGEAKPTNPSTNVNILAGASNDNKQASYNFVTFNDMTQMQKSKSITTRINNALLQLLIRVLLNSCC